MPGFINLAELDTQVDNVATTDAFPANRAAGAIWALAVERDLTHPDLTGEAGDVMVSWFATVAV